VLSYENKEDYPDIVYDAYPLTEDDKPIKLGNVFDNFEKLFIRE